MLVFAAMKMPGGRSVSWGCGVVVVLAVSACGGGSEGGSTPVTPTPVATTPVPATNTWSVAGQVIATGSQQGVGGASLTPGWSLAAVAADAQGNYQFGDTANPPSTPYPVTVSAPGFLSHDLWITWQRGPRTNVTLDLIRDAGPFSGDFYGQLVRGKYDQPGAPWPVLRWTTRAEVLREDGGPEWPGDRARGPRDRDRCAEPGRRPHGAVGACQRPRSRPASRRDRRSTTG